MAKKYLYYKCNLRTHNDEWFESSRECLTLIAVAAGRPGVCVLTPEFKSVQGFK